MKYLLTGGVRSGKSTYALKLALNSKKPFFIATAWAGDKEMEERIQNHKTERDDKWTTIEENLNIHVAARQAVESKADCIVIDCITLWVSNIMMQNELSVDSALDYFINELRQLKNTDVIIVTNEVGLGIVPDNELSRRYRDMLGFANQKLAATADKVIFMISGIPMEIKK